MRKPRLKRAMENNDPRTNLLDDDSQVVDTDEEAYYDPEQDGESIVVVEPKIITIGRKNQRESLRPMPDKPSHS